MAPPRRHRHDPEILVDPELERWRGAINERLDHLVDAVNALKDELKEERHAAAQHRQSLRDVIGANSVALGSLSENLKRIDPVVTTLEANRHRAQGFVWALRALWAAIGGAVGASLVKFGMR